MRLSLEAGPSEPYLAYQGPFLEGSGGRRPKIKCFWYQEMTWVGRETSSLTAFSHCTYADHAASPLSPDVRTSHSIVVERPGSMLNSSPKKLTSPSRRQPLATALPSFAIVNETMTVSPLPSKKRGRSNSPYRHFRSLWVNIIEKSTLFRRQKNYQRRNNSSGDAANHFCPSLHLFSSSALASRVGGTFGPPDSGVSTC